MDYRICSDRHGYTLVELMVVLFLTTVATVGMYKAYVLYSTAAAVEDQVVELQQNSRVAMQRLVRDLRMAGYDPLGTAGAGFVTATASKVSFTYDKNGSGVIDSGETITYQYDSTTDPDLELDGKALISTVSALYFVYYDENGTVATNNAEIRSVDIAILIRTTNQDFSYTNTNTYTLAGAVTYTPPTDDHYPRRLMKARVKCRNMGL